MSPIEDSARAHREKTQGRRGTSDNNKNNAEQKEEVQLFESVSFE
jgi:hypothetical protein